MIYNQLRIKKCKCLNNFFKPIWNLWIILKQKILSLIQNLWKKYNWFNKIHLPMPCLLMILKFKKLSKLFLKVILILINLWKKWVNNKKDKKLHHKKWNKKSLHLKNNKNHNHPHNLILHKQLKIKVITNTRKKILKKLFNSINKLSILNLDNLSTIIIKLLPIYN
jgi:hypothetical protein